MCPNKTSTTSDVATIGQIKTKVTKFQQKKHMGNICVMEVTKGKPQGKVNLAILVIKIIPLINEAIT